MGGQCIKHNWQVYDRPKKIVKCVWCGREVHIGTIPRNELQELALAFMPILEHE